MTFQPIRTRGRGKAAGRVPLFAGSPRHGVESPNLATDQGKVLSPGVDHPDGCYMIAGTMANLADQFTAIDVDDLLKPISDPSEIAVKWEDGTTSTFQISVTFTQTAFDGRRAFFKCPRCQRRSRKLYVNGLYKILACRCCLGLRYRSQERL